MNPFDAPPSTPAVSYEPPRPPRRRRSRVIGAAVLGAGLVGAGAMGANALDSSDDRESGASAPTSVESSGGGGDESVVRTASQDEQWGTRSTADLDEGDLRELYECLDLPEQWADAPFAGEEFDLEELPALDELFGDDFSLEELLGDDFALDELFGEFEGEFPMFEEWIADGELPPLDELFGEGFPLDELFGEFEGEFPMFEEWTVEGASVLPAPGEVDAMLDGLVAVMGPDGPIVIDLGDGDGSVTVERDGDTGEVTVTTDGDAVEVDLDELFEDLIVPMVPGEMQECLERLDADDT